MPKTDSILRKQYILLAVFAALLLVAALQEPFAQPLSYHLFADQRSWLGMPNTLDFLSNIPFAIVGLMGLLACQQATKSEIVTIFRVIFVGVFLTAFGSAYYHWNPNNATLVWDRLPMTIAFMGFFTYVLTDRVDRRCRYFLWPLLLAGAASVFYWGWSESVGAGDLRPYGLVQFAPIVLTLLVLYLFPASRNDLKYYLGLLLSYGAAKLLEHYDQGIWDLTGVVSGHPLKHLAAALGTWYILLLARHRLKQTL